MTDYRLVWEIDIDAASPLEAAKEALAVMRDPSSIATVFDVFTLEKQIRVDLEDESCVNI